MTAQSAIVGSSLLLQRSVFAHLRLRLRSFHPIPPRGSDVFWKPSSDRRGRVLKTVCERIEILGGRGALLGRNATAGELSISRRRSQPTTQCFNALIGGRRRGIANIVLAGITTDVCVHTTMREANDRGYECLLLADCTGATDYGNYLAALKMVKMQGGVFGAVSDSESFIRALF